MLFYWGKKDYCSGFVNVVLIYIGCGFFEDIVCFDKLEVFVSNFYFFMLVVYFLVFCL